MSRNVVLTSTAFQALQRLAVQYQKRDWQRANTDLSSSGVFAVWRSVVDATAQTAASRLDAAEKYRSLSGRASRSVRNEKDVRVKRGLEQLQAVQAEVLDALRELQQLKKNYHQLSHIASVARSKAADVQSRAKKNEHGIFHFKTGLHRTTAKLAARLKECEDGLTEARNHFLLTLAAVNAHHQFYYTEDLPHVLEQMDGSFYEDLKNDFCLLCETELDSCLNTHKYYSNIWDNVDKVTREKNIQQFLQESPVFNQPTEFEFQAAPRDQLCSLQDVCDSEVEGHLMKEAKKWAARAAKDHKMATHGERALQVLAGRLKLLSGQTGLSVERKISEVQHSVRKAEVSRIKAEARLALLANSVPGIEQWRSKAMNQAAEELERQRRLSERRRSTEDFSEEEFELTDFEEYDDDDRDIFTDPGSASGVCVYPADCKVIYSYQACQLDELSIIEGEELQVVEDGDVEDWLKVCNSCGQVGYVPERYVQILCLPAEDVVRLDTSFSSVSSLGKQEGTGTTGSAPSVIMTMGEFSSKEAEPYLSSGVARALYSYQAQSAEELSFQEGAMINLIRRQHGAVDDGFWEGELNGRRGFFPSLVVELIQDDREEEEEKEKQDKEVQTSHVLPLEAIQTPPTPTLPPLSISPTPGCSSVTRPPGFLEERRPTCADGVVSDSRLKPCRPPPPPPTLKPPPQL
ncbi:F-BAR and double SH3 domains protein 1 isoform X2 [Cynoglossus semilaevis]|uniref:F-BAR and double SH3 domains protein 1 isoform X2 n=1 Tax=Cynoglossus semilaevis TaxID=244447 RepID=UPI000D624C26|nr:F-BAR and double SH3 domains protein 1 isoform X2 [Cynoglossus semilaevis]